jgi:hypothetical protein
VKKRRPDELTSVVQWAARNGLNARERNNYWHGVWQVHVSKHPELSPRYAEFVKRVRKLTDKLEVTLKSKKENP